MTATTAPRVEPLSPGKQGRVKGCLPIYSLTPFTMLDFPGYVACVVWFSGCNMRCRYCHNPELVRKVGFKSPDEVLDFLKKRASLLDGLVLSGGEATLYPGLGDFMRQAKTLGYAIKLDTNGLRPDRVKAFLEDGLLDYVALDYKAPPQKFKAVTGVEKFDFFTQTLDDLCEQNKVDFEVRTTVHTDLLNEEDVNEIIRDLDKRGYQGTYYVQNFRGDDDRPTLAMMPEQQQELDRSKLCQPSGFKLGYRNF